LFSGFANMLGDGISMGMGDYLSSSAENDFAHRERERELWECENDIEAERREMVELYSLKKGITSDDARTIVDIISRDKDTFVDIMMVEELGIMTPDPDDSPWKNGLVTFGAFCVFGTVPLLPYVVHVSVINSTEKALASQPAFGIAIALTAICMFGLGALTSRFTAQHWLKAGLFTMANGGLAALASYGIAALVAYIFGVKV
jgi:vacuolar iron transporter family protein